MGEYVQAQPESELREKCMPKVQKGIDDHSPVLGRWRANNSPRSNMFFWLERTPEQVAVALTAMCLPFYRLRPCEFSEKNPGKHLKDLNLRYNSVSKFIALSILCSAVASKKQGIAAMERWIETGRYLREMRNYHMLFALQNALAKHQVDRLSFLERGISRKYKAVKKDFDELFSVKDRNKLFLKELAEFTGKEPLIPCVFWLVQKATLLQETPLWTGEGEFNVQRVTSAINIFADITLLQEKKYPPLREEEQILWYLMRLERDDLISDDELYVLSDAAKKQSTRFTVGSALAPEKEKKKEKKKGSGKGTSITHMDSPPVKKKTDDTVWARKKKQSFSGDRKGGGMDSPSASDTGNSMSTENSEELSGESLPPVPVLSLANVMDMANSTVSGKADNNFLNSLQTF
jgi:hypothetical protein